MYSSYFYERKQTMNEMFAMIGKKTFKLTNLTNADILFRNFAGVEKQYNNAGDRNFCVRLDEQIANELASMDIPVKILEPRDEDGEPLRFIKVKIKDFSKVYSANVGQHWPADMSLAERKEKQKLSEASYYSLDDANVQTAWITVSIYRWEMGAGPNKKRGTSLSLSEGFFKVEPNELEAQFFGIPDGESPMNTITFEQIKKKIED